MVRRQVKRGRVLTRKKGDGRAIELYYVDALSGREKTRSSGTTNAKEAERAAATWEAELLSTDGSGTNWNAAREAYERHLSGGVAASTSREYKRALDLFERLIGSPRDIAAISPLVLDDFAAKLRKQGRTPATQAKHLRGIRAFLRYCASREMLPRAPKVPMPRGSSLAKPKGQPISVSQFQELLKSLPEAYRVFAQGLWYSGLRSGEGIALHWSRGPVRLDLAHHRIEFDADGHKGKRVESMPLTSDCVAFFESLPDRDGPVLRCPAKSVATVSQAFDRACRSLAFRATPHDLRRSFATRWARVLNHAELQAIMRHKSVSTTLGYYAIFTAEDLADSIGRKSDGGNQ